MPFTPDTPTTNNPSGFIPDDQGNAESIANVAEAKDQALQEKFGGPGQQGLALVEGVVKGVAGPIAALSSKVMRNAAKSIGVSEENLNKIAPSPEGMLGREEANPITSTIGTIGGLLTPGGQGSLLVKAGEGVLKGAEKAVPSLVGEGILKGMSRGAIKVAAENALYQAGDETSKMILNDPNQTIGTAITNIGLAGALGAVAGGALGSVNPLWKAASETQAGELVSDFKTRMQEHLGIAEQDIPYSGPKSSDTVPNKVPKAGIDPFTKETISVTPTLDPNIRSNIDPFTKKSIEQPEIVKQTPIETKPLADTNGGKLADKFVKHADEYLNKGLGATIGGAIGHISGIPGGGAIGALLGERMLSPFLKSILPAIGKSILEKAPSGEGLKAAIDYSNNIIKGEKLTNAAIRNTFSKSPVLPDSKQPTVDMRKKLDAALQVYQQNPEKIASIGGAVGHYMPQHAQALGMIASNAVNFLNSIRPQAVQRAPLDPPLKPSIAVQAQYDRALDIAQQPLIVLKSIKDGTLTSNDVMALHTLYPDLYKGLRSKVMNQVVESTSKGETIPYNTRLGLSMFLQQPLDSTMKPLSIAMAQPMEKQPLSNSNDPNATKKSGKVSQAASSNLIKGSKSAQTASQSSEAMHSTGKA